jgi:phosphatidate phosphatase APP1
VVAGALGERARRLGRALRQALVPDPATVTAYRGYAAAAGDRALVLGRAARHVTLAPADAERPRWRNLVDALRRIDSDPLPHAHVGIQLAGAGHVVTADDEGFVEGWLPIGEPLEPGRWHPVTLALAGDARNDAQPAVGRILVPPPDAAFGVVSDLDDTVLQSEVANVVRAARLVLLENARTRLPFPGVAAFYQALQGGRTGQERNPIFYVSSSPWNLYDVIADFLDAHEIPEGPLLLRDWDLGPALRRSAEYKRRRLEQILDAYPALPFILVGDSAQEDPEIYGALARARPGRILAIYIRDVLRRAARTAAIQQLAADVQAAGSTLVLADDTLAAARHAAAHDWIAPTALGLIGGDARADAPRGVPVDAPTPAPADAAPMGTPTLVVDDTLDARDLA